MKTIVEINSVNFGSTGNIMLQIADEANKKGNMVYVACANRRSTRRKKVERQIFISNRFFLQINEIINKLTGRDSLLCKISTLLFIKKIKKIHPDIIHLHNLHGRYISLPVLFRYIKKNNIRTIWTLHDCWTFTGHCTYFDIVECDKWKTGCYNCPQYNDGYLRTWRDGSKKMYARKKKWLTGVKDMTLVTPSKWLAGLVSQSFLREYPVQVINNGIDLSIFKPTESNFREKYHCEDKFVVLGVAFGWGRRKGLDVFIELAKRLDERFQIVLVGTSEEVEAQLPANVICIRQTQNQTELAKIYTAADVFANPTREDNYPTVNMEALACGTPVITFRTGGSPEVIDDTCGIVVERGCINSMEYSIREVFMHRPFIADKCIDKAKTFNMHTKFEEYVQLYG